jgi:Protein of unknown function (DUF4054)
LALDPGLFRQQYPEFTDPQVYSDAVLASWDAIALLLLNPDRWSTLLTLGESLFVAHHLVIAGRNILAAKVGAAPGQVQGILTSKAIDKVAASYDASSVSMTDGGFWNMTVYGIQFLRLARQAGAGGVQIGLPC